VNGVSLAAIQTLSKITSDQQTQIDVLSAENMALKEQVNDLESRLSRLEQAAGNGAQSQSNGFLVWILIIVVVVVGARQAAPVVYCKIKKN
jgi:hypothetical protein